ncbi:hypothetical protein [Rhodopirellula halodulae]|uniref:hypothetical protein n=1 Tax=Rhodopirellula halodulae TaxID=2894198 RepID=UPI001E486D59|nr:hypothetical protein [Rhodopirellula sp. JC737]MCC9655693.1 hypothetical protein [Rhodopirellula sp. JC737]
MKLKSFPVACVLAFGACLASCGCRLPTGLTRSRWAMEHPEYAKKYADGAPKSDPLGKVKQASDARFLADAKGTYVSAGAAYRSNTGAGGSLEVGSESYLTSYMTQRMSLAATAGWDQASLGVDTGLRLQTPTRLAPFVGVGGYVGMNWETVEADDDGIDNDEDGHTDEFGEEDTEYDLALASIYPELGAHFWWTPQVRLTGFGRYWVTTNGRDSDAWIVGGGLAIFRD